MYQFISYYFYIVSFITMFSSDDYLVPVWSCSPLHSFHLEIIKDGLIIGNIGIKRKQFNLIGRVPDLCDLCIDNPSVSRKHAILQFKNGENFPFIYDLGGTHGTFVNKKKLPPRAYQKVLPFDMIKFGLSSRYYVLRCPELEHKQHQQHDQSENKFKQVLAQRKKELSKQEMKQHYLRLLQNDPYSRVKNGKNRLEGNEIVGGVNGVDWGISDEYDVYTYRNQNQLQLEPQTIRRLPGLDQLQLDKVAELQTNMLRYQQVEDELNELAHKQKREFGLEEKLRDKKQKLQKRFVEAVEILQKSEDWIRVNLFGQKQAKIVRRQRAQKEDDTFENDQFFDRTLRNKNQPNLSIHEEANSSKEQTEIFTTKDFWRLQKQFRSEVQNLIALQKQIESNNSNQQVLPQQLNEEDDLDIYMKQNNEGLKKEQIVLGNSRLAECQERILKIKQFLVPLVGPDEIQKMEDEERGTRSSRAQTAEQSSKLKEQEAKKKIDQTLNKLAIIKQMDQDVDEEDVKIFNYYKNQANDDNYEQAEDDVRPVRERPKQLEQEEHLYETRNKMHPLQQWSRDQGEKEHQEQQYYDLTKFK